MGRQWQEKCASALAWEPPDAMCAPKPQPASGHDPECERRRCGKYAEGGGPPRLSITPPGCCPTLGGPTFKRSQAARSSSHAGRGAGPPSSRAASATDHQRPKSSRSSSSLRHRVRSASPSSDRGSAVPHRPRAPNGAANTSTKLLKLRPLQGAAPQDFFQPRTFLITSQSG